MIERHRSIDPAHPGEILREDVLPALGMSKKSVAETLDISRQTLYDILNEKQPVTAEMVVRLVNSSATVHNSGSTCSAITAWLTRNAR